MNNTYEETLIDLTLADSHLVVMTAENRAPLRSAPARLGPRFIDTGITEQCMIGAAAGLALRGRIVVAHALASFLTLRAYEFIRTDLGIGNLPVKLIGFASGFLSEGNGPTHQAIEDVAILRCIPNMKVICPADHQQLVAAVPQIVKDPGPCYIRYNPREAVVKHSEEFELGQAEVLCRGTDVTILVYGMLFQEAYEARCLLEKQGISVYFINLHTLQPVDASAIAAAVSATALTVTIEDHLLIGGLNSIVAEICLALRLAPRVVPFALDSRWFKPGRLVEVLTHEGFSGHQLAKRINKALQET
jgi:transketolase